MSTVHEYIDGCTKQYRCAMDIYLMTVLQSLYDIIMDRSINAPSNGNNVVDGIDYTENVI